MEFAFYDNSGKPVAYTDDGIHLHRFSGHAMAFIHEDSIYDYSGRHLGWLVDGWVREHSGRCVYFTEKAKGGPFKPYMHIEPNRVTRQIPPAKGVLQKKRFRPTWSPYWSAANGEQFFSWYCTL